MEPLNLDFLTVNPSDPKYERVTHMSVIIPHTFILIPTFMYSLLDPSCSGSGIVNRLDHLLEAGMSL